MNLELQRQSRTRIVGTLIGALAAFAWISMAALATIEADALLKETQAVLSPS